MGTGTGTGHELISRIAALTTQLAGLAAPSHDQMGHDQMARYLDTKAGLLTDIASYYADLYGPGHPQTIHVGQAAQHAWQAATRFRATIAGHHDPGPAANATEGTPQ